MIPIAATSKAAGMKYIGKHESSALRAHGPREVLRWDHHLACGQACCDVLSGLLLDTVVPFRSEKEELLT